MAAMHEDESHNLMEVSRIFEDVLEVFFFTFINSFYCNSHVANSYSYMTASVFNSEFIVLDSGCSIKVQEVSGKSM